MARALHTDGTDPSREPRTEVRGGREVTIHACNMCGSDLEEIRLPTLSFWRPSFKWVRKYPLRYGTFLCEGCKGEMGFEAVGFIAVPQAEGQDFVSALKDYLNLIEEHQKRLPSD